MAVLKCTVCGGELEVNVELTVGVCKFCESTIVIPKELDRKGNLYNRAVFLRQNNEFDKAVATYEDILKEDNSDADAHWGLVLSKYGIEYVSDPRTNERIPTCHRTQAASILSDPDYLAAVEFSADESSRRVIEEEGRRISEIQAKILEISRKEPPYDIFICYKESDEAGRRTEDSAIAQDLYYELLKKNYRVFFARKTLESKLGTEYEPIIFAALSSARVMIVLGTRPEHFNSVWVRNEWSRFSKMSGDARKTIIPAYRGMSPYELPAELSALQSQDMSRIGFMQDLLDGIERCMRSEKRAAASAAVAAGAAAFGSAPLERLLQNCQTYLKLGNYADAESVYKTVTRDYPEDHRGWWGLMVCRTLNFTAPSLDQSELNVWFGYVKQLAEPKDFEELQSAYVEYTRKVSGLAALEDMKGVNSVISGHAGRISDLEKSIEATNGQIKSREQAFSAQTGADNSEIKKQENEISANRSFKSTWAAKVTIGVILLVLGPILAVALASIFILVGIVFVIVGICLCSSSRKHGNKAVLDKRLYDATAALSTAKKDKEAHQAQYDRDIAAFNEKISGLNAEIAAVQSKISDCRRYLELGRDRIATYWFSQECAQFGVEQSYDSQIEDYRKAAFSAAEKQTEETVTLTCPACGEPITAARRQLSQTGRVICQTCGNTIEVELLDTPEGGGAEDTQAGAPEIACPACGESFNVDGAALQSGRCYCPTCGAAITLGN